MRMGDALDGGRNSTVPSDWGDDDGTDGDCDTRALNGGVCDEDLENSKSIRDASSLDNGDAAGWCRACSRACDEATMR